MARLLFSLMLIFAATNSAFAQDQTAPEPPMTLERLGEIIFALDETAQSNGPHF